MGLPTSATTDIVDLASGIDAFSTLVSLVVSAGLVDTLKGDGPFTLFAPTNEAFEKIDSETLEDLQSDPDALAKVLTYHVVSGNVMSGDLTKGKVTTVEGSTVSVTLDPVMINDSKVTSA